MIFSNAVTQLYKSVSRLSGWFEWIAVGGLLGMLVATSVDVVGAKLFQWPLPGGFEAVSLLQVIVIASAIAYAKIDGRHIRLEFIINIIPQRIRHMLNIFTSFLGLSLFVVLVWKSYEYGLEFMRSGKVTTTAEFPFFPFAFWLAICCIPISLLLLLDLLDSVQRLFNK